MYQSHSSVSGNIAIIVASILWGTTGTVASFAHGVSPYAIGAFAMGVGGILLVFCSLKRLFQDKEVILGSLHIFLAGGLAVALYPLAFYSSMHLAGVALGTVVSIACAPLFSVLLERLVSKKRICSRWFFSFLFGSSGVVTLIFGQDGFSMSDSGSIQDYIGIILGLIAGLTYATYSWSAKFLMDKGVHSSSAMAGMFGVAAVILIPSLAVTGGNLFSSVTNSVVAWYMAIVPMFFGYLCFSYGLIFIEASNATLITLIEPVVATFLAIVVVGERFSYMGWIGMFLILLCLICQLIEFPVPRFNLRADAV